MSISTKFGHSICKGSRDARPPPVSGKDFLMACGIGLKRNSLQFKPRTTYIYRLQNRFSEDIHNRALLADGENKLKSDEGEAGILCVGEIDV